VHSHRRSTIAVEQNVPFERHERAPLGSSVDQKPLIGGKNKAVENNQAADIFRITTERAKMMSVNFEKGAFHECMSSEGCRLPPILLSFWMISIPTANDSYIVWDSGILRGHFFLTQIIRPMSYPLCVFLDSRKHGRLPVDHPFYRFVKETLQHVIDSTLVLRYMAKNQTGSFPSEAEEQRRVQDIIQYLKSNCPTVSGSDSPAMNSMNLVNTRAYSGCGKDRKNGKLARKHVYIQKSLIDGWTKTRSEPSMRGTYL
jgi:hypothetical protein